MNPNAENTEKALSGKYRDYIIYENPDDLLNNMTSLAGVYYI